MALTVLQIGADTPEALVAAVRSVLPDEEYSLQLLEAKRTKAMEYRPAPGQGLEQAAQELVGGQASSLRIVPNSGPVSWAILYCPGFDGTGPPIWNAAIEVRTLTPESLIEPVLGVPGVRYIAVAYEEMIEFDSVPDAGSFPWNESTLVVGVVRKDGELVIRKGPAALHY